MKKYFFFLLLFMSASMQAQNNLIGVWRASCPLAKGLPSGKKYCELCPASTDSLSENRTAEDFDFIVEQGGLTFTSNDATGRFHSVAYEMIDYIWDKEKHLLSFSFLGKKYNFTAYYNNSILDNSDDILLQNNDDETLVLLKQKKVEVTH